MKEMTTSTVLTVRSPSFVFGAVVKKVVKIHPKYLATYTCNYPLETWGSIFVKFLNIRNNYNLSKYFFNNCTQQRQF